MRVQANIFILTGVTATPGGGRIDIGAKVIYGGGGGDGGHGTVGGG